MSGRGSSVKKKYHSEWHECSFCRKKFLSISKETHDCSNFTAYPIIESVGETLRLCMLVNSYKLLNNSTLNDDEKYDGFVFLSFQTMTQLNMCFGSWCIVHFEDSALNQKLTMKCLPSKSVKAGYFSSSTKFSFLNQMKESSLVKIQPILDSKIFNITALEVKIKLTNNDSRQLPPLLFSNPSFVEGVVRETVCGMLLYEGQIIQMKLYGTDISLKIVTLDFLERAFIQLNIDSCDNFSSHVDDGLMFGRIDKQSILNLSLDENTLGGGGSQDREDVSFITFEDIGGYSILKKKVFEEVVCQLLGQPNDNGSKSTVLGVVIHGCSGVGKTYFGEALAGELGVDLCSILTKMEDHKSLLPSRESDKKPPIVFILDNLEHRLKQQIGTVTTSSDISRASYIENTRNFFDSLRKIRGHRILVIGICNDIDLLDSSLRRTDYYEQEYEVNAPDQQSRFEILSKMHVKYYASYKIDGEHLRQLSGNAHGYIASDLRCVLKFAVQSSRLTSQVDMEHLLEAALQRVKPSAMKEIVLDIPQVKWSDIGGQNELKTKLRQCIEWPVKNPDKFLKFGIKPPRGVLLYGPPGCSKTMIAKALATETGLNFLSVKGPEIYDKYVGQSEKAIRSLFRRARQAAPVIIFFDEIDAIAPSRGNSSNNSVSDRVLTQLLTEMDGVEKLDNVVIVAATNRPDIIDGALLRPGRIDKLLYVPLPDKETREQIFTIKLKNMPIDDVFDEVKSCVAVKSLVDKSEGFSGAEVCALCDEAAMNALKRNMKECESEGGKGDCGGDERIMMDDFMEAFKIVKPLTNSKSLEKYAVFSHIS